MYLQAYPERMHRTDSFEPCGTVPNYLRHDLSAEAFKRLVLEARMADQLNRDPSQ
jgi:hypothetical protein